MTPVVKDLIVNCFLDYHSGKVCLNMDDRITLQAHLNDCVKKKESLEVHKLFLKKIKCADPGKLFCTNIYGLQDEDLVATLLSPTTLGDLVQVEEVVSA